MNNLILSRICDYHTSSVASNITRISPCPSCDDTQGGEEEELHSFLTSTLYGSDWSTSGTKQFIPKKKEHHYQLNRRMDGPQSRSGSFREEKNFCLCGIRTHASPSRSNTSIYSTDEIIIDTRLTGARRTATRTFVTHSSRKCLLAIRSVRAMSRHGTHKMVAGFSPLMLLALRSGYSVFEA